VIAGDTAKHLSLAVAPIVLTTDGTRSAHRRRIVRCYALRAGV
jgi:hypothetical protein